MNRRAPPAGFTLVELMVVVAILGVLATMAFVSIKPKTRPIDMAGQFAGLVSDASRVAVRGGPVRSDVALAEGSKRRSRIVGFVSGATVAFEVQVLVEEPGVATLHWDALKTLAMPASVTAVEFSTSVGAHASVTLISDWNSFVISCFPSGSCTAASLFLASAEGPLAERQARVSVLPLGTAAYVKNDWN